MANIQSTPAALTIAGSDSGGGAGIQADLKTFAAFGIHGTCAITCITAQNPRRVLAAQACSPALLKQQITAVWEELPPAAIKVGMLANAANVRLVANFLKKHPQIPVIVDPVMISTSGTKLLDPAGLKLLLKELLPLAALVTPNVDETALLTARRPRSVEDLRQAARHIHNRFGCAVLVKGGHLRGLRTAVDIFYDGQTELFLGAPFVRGVTTHGTGCTYSAAVTASLASGHTLPAAVEAAKHYITRAIARSQRVGKHFVLAHLA